MKRPLPAELYTAPDAYARDREAIFAREWLVLAALDAIPSGHATALTVAGLPIVLRREGDDVQGFVNVCRHRAGPLVWDGETEPCPRFRCKYHGWQYRPDGTLLRTPGFGVQAPPLALTPVHTRVWRGLVFGSLAGSIDLEPRLSALSAAPDWSGWRVGARRQHTLACNWKTYVENYLEGYHIPYLHPGLSAEVDLDTYRVEAAEGVVRHFVEPGDDATYTGFWAFVWPNTAINVYRDGLSLERIVPVSQACTVIDYTFLFAPGATEARRSEAIAMSDTVTAEDVRICEAVQRNLASGRYSPGVLSPRHEAGIAAFQDWIRAAFS